MAAAPLELVVSLDGAGVPGLHPVVSIRDVSSNNYLDFADGTLKASGWTTKAASMTDLGTGFYQRVLAVASTSGLVVGQTVVAEYHVPDVGYVGDTLEVVHITDVETNTELLRKVATNRLEEAAGNPGILTLFDDDAQTPLKSWRLRDANGNAVVATVGSPAKRSAAT